MKHYHLPASSTLAKLLSDTISFDLDLPPHILDHVREALTFGLAVEDKGLLADYCEELGIEV